VELIKHDTHINFVGRIKLAGVVSAVLVLIALGTLVAKGGPRYGIDFVGGTLVQMRFNSAVSSDQIRSALAPVVGGDASVQPIGDEADHEFLINVPAVEKETGLAGLSDLIAEEFETTFGAEGFEVRRTEMVGPKVGHELRRKGMMAVFLSLLGMLAYIWFRFEFRFGIGAVIALAHDVVITLGVLSLTNTAIDLPIIAALLTVVGYSVNDTIIVCDRIRENQRRMTRQPLGEIVNVSINQTLSRTIITSGTTLLVVITLFVFGGGVIHDFAKTLLIGVVVGTYSSVFIASPVLILWENWSIRRKSKSPELKGRAV
jgi:preprotein translocase subunit SecF